MSKKLSFLFPAILISFCLALVACSDDDEPNLKGIIGTWDAAMISTDGGNEYEAWPYQPTTFTFNSNGTYTFTGKYGEKSGTWSQNGSTITTTVMNRDDSKYEFVELTTSTCTLVRWTIGYTDLSYIKCIRR